MSSLEVIKENDKIGYAGLLEATVERFSPLTEKEELLVRIAFKVACDRFGVELASSAETRNDNKMVGERTYRRIRVREHRDNDWIHVPDDIEDGFYLATDKRTLSNKYAVRVPVEVINGRMINVHPDLQIPVGDHIFLWEQYRNNHTYEHTFKAIKDITNYIVTREEMSEVIKAIRKDEGL